MSAPPTTHDREWMQRALTLASHGPIADPNPRVGAVIVRAGAEVGAGHHAGAGTPHAEVMALRAAGEQALGATAYVTLEPCRHVGRTPACTQALLEAGIARVVYAAADPGPQSGGGATELADAGLEVLGGVLADEAAALNEAWESAVRLGRPKVTWKIAGTLDGRLAAADGSSAWITSPQARADGHQLRSQVGAIMVGTGTALIDDPQLTARDAVGEALEQQPLRVVVGHRDLPSQSNLQRAPGYLAVRSHDPHEVLAQLHTREIRHVLLEGGPGLAGAFWECGLVDEVVAYLAPALLGAGQPIIADLGIGTIADIARLEFTDVSRVGPDVRLVAHPKKES